MPLPKSFTTVTPFSKLLAMFLFILFPFVGFYLGTQYQRDLDIQNPEKPTIIESLFCKKWETVCDPNYTDPNGGCAPKRICLDSPSTTPAQPINTQPKCTPHVPIGGTGSIPANYVYPTLPPGGSWCPSTQPTTGSKMCPMLAFKNAEGKTCTYTGPNCEVRCK